MVQTLLVAVAAVLVLLVLMPRLALQAEMVAQDYQAQYLVLPLSMEAVEEAVTAAQEVQAAAVQVVAQALLELQTQGAAAVVD